MSRRIIQAKIQHSVWNIGAMSRWIQLDLKEKNTILDFECDYSYYSIDLAHIINLSKQSFSTIYAPLVLEIVF